MSDEKQSFSRIRSIEARDGQILIRTKSEHTDGGANPINETVLSVREAGERATALNNMANKFAPADRQVVDDLIAEIIERCEEAQQQIIRAETIPDAIKIKATAGLPNTDRSDRKPVVFGPMGVVLDGSGKAFHPDIPAVESEK